jgi:hypothetical protein
VKVTGIKKLIVEDFPATTRETVQRLAQILNPFLDVVTKALTNGLTIKDNLKAQSFPLELAAGVSTQTVKWTLNEAPSEVRISRLAIKGGTAPAAAFSLFWAYEAPEIRLTFIGLNAGSIHETTVTGQV